MVNNDGDFRAKKKIKVSELCQGYTDDGDGGVYSEKKKNSPQGLSTLRAILDFGLNLMTLHGI